MAEVKSTRIFLSYSRKDVGQVNELYEKLKGYGFSPWQDHRDIIGGRWLDAIKKAIKESTFFIICLSEHSVNQQTGVLVYEINEALEMMNYRHRSHIYILPVRFDDSQPPEELTEFQWFDLFAPDGFEKLLRALRHGLKQLGFSAPLNLRSEPLKNLSPAEAAQMIKERNFFDSEWWPSGQGIHHEYEPKTIKGDKVAIDHTTGLMWQQSGSSEYVEYKKVQKYIAELNANKFAGFNDWRLPTLEEAMSLMETEKKNDVLYIDPVFDTSQEWIWTADRHSASRAWFVGFDSGYCLAHRVGSTNCVRAVRSGQSLII